MFEGRGVEFWPSDTPNSIRKFLGMEMKEKIEPNDLKYLHQSFQF